MVGFVGNPSKEGKWDGHVICSTGHYFIDTALHQFKAEFDLDTPSVFIGTQFTLPTQVISQRDLSDGNRLWWYRPPPGAGLAIPQTPPELISGYASQFIERLMSEKERQSA